MVTLSLGFGIGGIIITCILVYILVKGIVAIFKGIFHGFMRLIGKE